MNELADEFTYKWIPLLKVIAPETGGYVNEVCVLFPLVE
jgi:hypothetical protein